MMYSEFQALFEKAKPDAPVPTPEAYHESIEPFYMAANMDKADFVKLYAKLPVPISNVAEELAKKDKTIRERLRVFEAERGNAAKAEAQFKETVDAMAKRQKELEERVALLARENEATLNENGRLQIEAESLRNRYARLVRGLCDDCFEKVLFGERAAAETEEND